MYIGWTDLCFFFFISFDMVYLLRHGLSPSTRFYGTTRSLFISSLCAPSMRCLYASGSHHLTGFATSLSFFMFVSLDSPAYIQNIPSIRTHTCTWLLAYIFLHFSFFLFSYPTPHPPLSLPTLRAATPTLPPLPAFLRATPPTRTRMRHPHFGDTYTIPSYCILRSASRVEPY
ncbi:hypothetical protein C8R44DRAFT_16210 [Mycena epipterygia]|nr:hypothetical protein C8R44DRAFT_16210 [Mycena epipterygia]